MKLEFLSHVWNSDVTEQLKRHQIPTTVSLKARIYNKECLEFMRYWNLILLLPSQMC